MNTGLGSDGLWLSITALAIRENISKQAIAEKVARLEADGQIKTRPGKGRVKLVNVAEYLTAVGRSGDIAREMTAADMAADGAAPENAPAYREAQIREKQLSADLKQLELMRQLGEVVPIGDLSALATETFELIVRIIERLPARADEMAAAVGHDGAVGARCMFKRIVFDLRTEIAAALKVMADSPLGRPSTQQTTTSPLANP